ncbi:hypothetical protein C8J57DRAFT_1271832 [Mycena rebaudengoi]|nr:hypothetical protein C8J57DRAFT_1271832 [Mycena rebaudengoi]
MILHVLFGVLSSVACNASRVFFANNFCQRVFTTGLGAPCLRHLGSGLGLVRHGYAVKECEGVGQGKLRFDFLFFKNQLVVFIRGSDVPDQGVGECRRSISPVPELPKSRRIYALPLQAERLDISLSLVGSPIAWRLQRCDVEPPA